MTYRRSTSLLLTMSLSAGAFAQQATVVVKPIETNAVLANPGIGFTTFQRFNGDSLNAGTSWTEGFPIDYQPFRGKLQVEGYPLTTIAYFRVYWRFIEPEKGVYRWDLIDNALKTARGRNQTLMLRIAPHGTDSASDVPAWYRQETHEDFHQAQGGWNATKGKWLIDPENPAYAKEFGDMIRAFGARYDGNPDLELIDISILAAWGEGAGTNLLTPQTRRALVDSYMDSFHKTPLVTQLGDKETVGYTLSRASTAVVDTSTQQRDHDLDEEAPRVGWRADCLGDMGGFSKTRDLMTDQYPEDIIELGLSDVWKTAPVTMEACWVMQHWKDAGWDPSYIMDQAIKWHVSSFNAKSAAVPAAWQPLVDSWLNRMGYRFALRRFTYPGSVDAGRKLAFTSWWDNKGDAPIYREYPLALRLKSQKDQKDSIVMLTGADVRTWLPGDNLYNSAVFVPASLPDAVYQLQVALVDPVTHEPKVKLAIQGTEADGWYSLGAIELRTQDRSGAK